MNNAQLKVKNACSVNEVNNPGLRVDKRDVGKLLFQQVVTMSARIISFAIYYCLRTLQNSYQRTCKTLLMELFNTYSS